MDTFGPPLYPARLKIQGRTQAPTSLWLVAGLARSARRIHMMSRDLNAHFGSDCVLHSTDLVDDYGGGRGHDRGNSLDRPRTGHRPTPDGRRAARGGARLH